MWGVGDMEIWSGQQLAIVGAFSLSGSAQTPSFARCTIWHSASGSATYSYPGDAQIFEAEPGTLILNWRFDLPGYWRWHWQGVSGVVAAAASGLICRVPF